MKTKNILLINPHVSNKFYINPFYLQVIAARIKRLMPPNTNVYIHDINCNQGKIQCAADVVIIDTPEGSCKEVKTIIDSFSNQKILLVGDTIKYGQAERMLEYCARHSDNSISYCIHDDRIAGIVESLCSETNAKTNETSKNEDESQECNAIGTDINSKLKIEFSDNIIRAYEMQGIQMFLDGISRGCENNCSFCKLGNNPLLVHKVISSEVSVVEIVTDLKNRCSKRLFIQFTDENFFGGGIKRLEQITTLAHDLNKISFDGYLGVDTRLDTVLNPSDSDEKAKSRANAWNALCGVGLRYCFLGIESFAYTQSIRYSKNLDLRNFDRVISFLSNHNVVFTIGLILWDPLMSTVELRENLRFIKDHHLIGKTASLLKQLRIQINSRYWNDNKKQIMSSQIETDDFFHVSSSSYEYRDPYIKQMLPYVNDIYTLFNNNGYRHSDVALFDVVLSGCPHRILLDIPVLISQMEYDILIYLLSIEKITELNIDIVRLYTLQRVYKTVSYIYSELNSLGAAISKDDIEYSIYSYYCVVFARIMNNLDSL